MDAASETSSASILMIEAFYGGSHKQLIDLLYTEFKNETVLATLPAKKWHWRARTAALHFVETIPLKHNFKILFTSSVLNLSELVALRPDLTKLKKIVYFHENQLNYPVQVVKDRDFHFGYSQILTSMVSDLNIFNSQYNRDSFLNGIKKHLKIIPDHRPTSDLAEKIRPKCSILYFPLQVSSSLIRASSPSTDKNKPLLIVWPHRWEYDKAPATFFNTLYKLLDDGLDFRISVLGESYQEIPSEFIDAKLKLEGYIHKWGYQESKESYYSALTEADVVVSTSIHEFFGVALLEAVTCGCYPLCPKRLVYPEIFPEQYLYNTDNQLYKKLKHFCKNPASARNHKVAIDFCRFSWDHQRTKFSELFTSNTDVPIQS